MDQTPKTTETKKGINWLNVIGLVVLIILIGAAFVLIPLLKDMQANKIVQDVSGMQPWLSAMESMTKAQIANEAAHVSAAELLTSPTGYDGRWVVTWGPVSSEESNAVAGNIARNIMSEKNYPAFILANGVVFVDVSGEGELTVPDGSVITGYGKVFNLKINDIWALPIVGPNLKKEFDNVEGMEDTVVFFLSKGYDIGEPGQAGSLIAPPVEGAAATGTEAPAETAPVEGAEAGAGDAGEGEGTGGSGEGGAEAPPAGDPPAAPKAGE